MSCPEPPKQDMGKTAKDACNKISSKAEEIEAASNGMANIVTQMSPITALIKGIGGGDNNVSTMMRNIISTNLSTCDQKKISNDCINSTASDQINILDNSKCKYCDNNLCEMSNIRQTNAAEISQSCTIQSAIETLLQKTSSVDAQALAQVLQKADGLMSGTNNYKSENCNVIDNDLSSQTYLENRSSCANKLTVDQENSIKFCGKLTDVIQENKFKALQDCLVKDTVTTSVDLKSSVKTLQDNKIEQKTSGLDLFASFASVGGSIIPIIISIVLSISTFLFMMMMMN